MGLDLNIRLGDHFKAREFQCHDGSDLPDLFNSTISHTVEFLERLRGFQNFWLFKETGEWVDLGVHILSGYRNLKYNLKIGSTRTSAHVSGHAADVLPSGGFRRITYQQFYEMIILVDKSFSNRPYRIGKYTRSGFVHIDCKYGHGATRWVGN